MQLNVEELTAEQKTLLKGPSEVKLIIKMKKKLKILLIFC